jgi:hypothetical protein
MTDLGHTGLRSSSKEDWDVIGSAMLGACEEAAAAPDATFAGRALSWLKNYAGKAIRWGSDKKVLNAETPILRDGYLFCFSGDLHKHITLNIGDRCTPHEMALCLRKAGAVPDVLEIEIAAGEKKTKANRDGWRIPEGLLQFAVNGQSREPIPDVFLAVEEERGLPF